MKRNAIKHANAKPFHVLPILVANSSNEMAVKKNPNLKISIDKDSKKSSNSKETKIERPLTATLEKPTIIDIRFVGKIDMSLMRKEFLNITNLCKIPLVIKKTSVQRPLSLPTPLKFKNHKKNKTSNIIVSNNCDIMKSETIINNSIISKLVCSSKGKDVHQSIKGKPDISKYDANNNHQSGNPIQSHNNNHDNSLRKHRINTMKQDNQKSSCHSDNNNSIKLVVAEPCKSCGRKSHPERFHSHPHKLHKEPVKSMDKVIVTPVKSTVQKPVAMTYISKINSRKSIRPIKTIKTASSKSVPSSPKKLTQTQQQIINSPNTTRSSSGKKTVTCYLCGREFGTYSLPLHEPKCLQKWEATNANLPKHLQRKPPVRPSTSISKEERDILAWEASQSTLIPCQNCGRTFQYDRLIVHKRSCCKTLPNYQIKESTVTTEQIPGSSNTPKSSTRRGPPPTFECYICGRTFGVNSIGIHERHCLKKWTVENDLLPPDIRSPPPVRKANNKPEKSTAPAPDKRPTTTNIRKHNIPTTNIDVQNSNNNSVLDVSLPPSSGRKQQRPPLFPCYICGKLFTVHSIYTHEPQCLKIWHSENDKLPPNRRKPQPIKPDIKFTPSGGVDFLGTFNRIWDNHLAELIECRKCGRKFFPNRIEKHQKVCANIKINVKNNLSK